MVGCVDGILQLSCLVQPCWAGGGNTATMRQKGSCDLTSLLVSSSAALHPAPPTRSFFLLQSIRRLASPGGSPVDAISRSDLETIWVRNCGEPTGSRDRIPRLPTAHCPPLTPLPSPSRRPSQTSRAPKTRPTRPRAATAARGAACFGFQEPRLRLGKGQGKAGEMSCTTAAPTPHAQDE